jgi:hypothetical protein
MDKAQQYQVLAQELSLYKKLLGQASDTIVEQDVSKYPIFVLHQHQVEIGLLLVDKTQVEGNWTVNVSTLEEFVTKQIVLTEQLDNFKKNFKSTQTHHCLFVLSELGAQFIFLPRG